VKVAVVAVVSLPAILKFMLILAKDDSFKGSKGKFLHK
jgi:hypothetical protein